MLAENFSIISILGNICMFILSITLYRKYKYLCKKLKNSYTKYLAREMTFVLSQLKRVAEKVQIEDLSRRDEYNRELGKVIAVAKTDKPEEIMAFARSLLKLISEIKLVCKECERDTIMNFFKFGVNSSKIPLTNPMEFIINNLIERNELESSKRKCLQVIDRMSNLN